MRVAVAMSGGIDSTYSAFILKEQGFEVVGVSFELFEGQMTEAIAKVRVAAQALAIPHLVIDLRAEFQRLVIEPFINGYKQGITPNPCALCNRKIKFGLAMDLALQKTGADLYATGHYAGLGTFQGYLTFTVAEDRRRDQSYFLALIPKDRLKGLLFPLGKVPKKEFVLKVLQGVGIDLWQDIRGSQDVCFLRRKDLSEFLREHLGSQKGEVIYQGKVMGRHEGYYFYTIGQRSGIGVRAGKRLYVSEVSPTDNRLYLAEREALLSDEVLVSSLNAIVPLELWKKPLAQVRYRSEKVRVSVLEMVDEGILKLKLDQKVFAVTAGQVCAFYEEDYLLGGGIIEPPKSPQSC